MDLGWHNNLPVIIVPGFGSSTLHVVTSKVRHLPIFFLCDRSGAVFRRAHTVFGDAHTATAGVAGPREAARVDQCQNAHGKPPGAPPPPRSVSLLARVLGSSCSATRRVLAPALLHARSEYNRVLEYLSRYGIR